MVCVRLPGTGSSQSCSPRLDMVFGNLQEIPTHRVKPLTPQCDTWCEFPVADRPNAVRQFFDAADKDPSLIQAPWILMIETDYVWMSPLQGVPLAESSLPGWGFPYGYIVPTYPGTVPCAMNRAS
jgi:hydroxyproline O-arabinosyltransferase